MNSKSSNTIFKKGWFKGIVAFCLMQIAFMTMEWTGWIPKFRDTDGRFLGDLMDAMQLNEWASFYETVHFNFITVLFVIVWLTQICFTSIQFVFRKRSA